MDGLRRILVCSATVALSTTTALAASAGPAAASHIGCGDTITVSTTFDSNVGPCETGLVIGADDVTLDLNGFTLSGTPAVGDGPGIDISGRSGVTVRNGTITQFDAGVAITGGSGNTISDNLVRNNGPYSGISLVASSGNLVEHNQVTGNNQSTTNTSGIRVENVGQTSSNSNTIRDNLVQGSALDGIQLFAGSSDNLVSHNVSVQNNRDGITAFAGSKRNTIEDNEVRYNGFGPIAGNGIYIRGAAGSFPAPSANVIRRNVSTNNALFDLRDGTPGCGTNVWSANQGVTGTPPCVFNP